MRVGIGVAVVLLVAGCKGNEVKSTALKLSWKPPRGVSQVEETADVLRFTQGVEIHSIEGAPPPIDEGKLDLLLLDVFPRAKIDLLPTRISARVGSVPAGSVARWVLAGGGGRALHYYLPLKGRFLTISMTAPEGDFGTRESQLDLSLASLKVE